MPLRKTTNFVLILWVTYLLISMFLVYGIFTKGLFGWQNFFSQVITKILFSVMKVQLFLILACVDLNISLHTQVLVSSEIVIIGVNRLNKECFRFVVAA